MRIGYAKLGRSWRLDPRKGTVTGGDVDVRRALDRLAYVHTDHEFVLVGRNSGEDPADVWLPSNVTNPWTDLQPIYSGAKGETDVMALHREYAIPLFADLDALIVWAGQHGTHNSSIPLLDGSGRLSTTQANFFNYAGYIVHGINAWRNKDPRNREEIWLCPDPRNYIKARDLQWPLQHPVIAQYEWKRHTVHERYGDTTSPLDFNAEWYHKAPTSVWKAPSHYVYSGLELTTLQHPERVEASYQHGGRHDFGILLNENRAYVSRNRLDAVRDWVLASWPQAEIFGKWRTEAKVELGRTDIRECPYAHLTTTLQRWRCTLTTPASGTGWATAKPWECFAVGTVCFFHPDYDTQDNILSDAPPWLHAWLRVKTPAELLHRVETLAVSPENWLRIVQAQRAHFEKRFTDTRGGVKAIEERLGLL